MSVPETLPLESGGAVVISVVGGKVLMVTPESGAVLTRPECEHLGDILWHAGVRAESAAHATMITSSDDERVRNDR